METYRCIYCLNQKPRSEFNREHVISRFMGTYENAYVLGNQQVCKACNSFFATILRMRSRSIPWRAYLGSNIVLHQYIQIGRSVERA